MNKFKLVESDVLNFDECLSNFVSKKSLVKISKVKRIDYFPNGNVLFSNNYEIGIQKQNLLKSNVNVKL